MVPIIERAGADRSRLEHIVERFERACLAGDWPRIEDTLPDGPDRLAVLVELAHAELELRLKAGHGVGAEHYLRRFPELAGDPATARELAACERALRGRAGRPPTIPPRVGRFELREEIGRGSTSVVYRAHDAELDREVALKLLLRSGESGAGGPDGRFLREARYVARLRHPGIVPLHEAGRADGLCYLVSELVDGPTLAGLLASARPEHRGAAELVALLAEALDHAHRRGIVHRDLKPSNILIDPEGRPLLADFGLARHVGGDATLTADGMILGTPCYMAPEQARGQAGRVDARGDVYSLGVVLFELLTGELPFRGSPRMVLAQVIQDDPIPPRRLDESIPRDLETICVRAMAAEPSRRYPTAGALADDLRRFLDGRPVLARPLGPAARLARRCRRRPVVAGLSAALAAAVAIGLLGVCWQWWRAEAHLSEARRQRDRLIESFRQTDRMTALLFAAVPLDPDQETSPWADSGSHQASLERLPRDLHLLSELGFEGRRDLEAIASLQHRFGLVLQSSGRHDDALQVLRQALESWEAWARRQPDPPDVDPRLGAITRDLGRLLDRVGRAEEAEAVLRRCLSHWLAVAGRWDARARDLPDDPRPLRHLVTIHGLLAGLRSRLEPASTAHLDHVRLRLNALTRLCEREPDDEQLVLLFKSILPDFIRRFREARRQAEAIPTLERVVALAERLDRDDPGYFSADQLGTSLFHLGAFLNDLDRPAEALPVFLRTMEPAERAALASRRPDRRIGVATLLHSLGNTLADLDRPVEAVPYYRQAAEIREAVRAEEPEDIEHLRSTGGTWHRLAEALESLGDLRGSVTASRRAIALERAALAEDPSEDRLAELAHYEDVLHRARARVAAPPAPVDPGQGIAVMGVDTERPGGRDDPRSGAD